MFIKTKNKFLILFSHTLAPLEVDENQTQEEEEKKLPAKFFLILRQRLFPLCLLGIIERYLEIKHSVVLKLNYPCITCKNE